VYLLNHALAWLPILAVLLPSLARAGPRAIVHLVDLVSLAYVARFAPVAALIDPFRRLPDGVDALVWTFCVSSVDLAAFGLAATLVAAVATRVQPAAIPARLAA
jgi:hypothetical protein